MERPLNNSLGRYGVNATGPSLFLLNTAAIFLLFLSLAAAIAAGTTLGAVLVGTAIVAVGAFTAVALIRRSSAQSAKAVDWVEWRSALPEIQKQNLNIAVSELARILEVGHDSMSDLQSAFIVAEDLAFRQLQEEEAVPILRHINICGVPFDVVFVKNGVLHCGEAAFLVAPELSATRLASIQKKMEAVHRSVTEMNVGLKLRLLLILVTQMNEDDLETLRASLDASRFNSTLVDIDIRLLDFEVLQRIFVTDK